MLIVHSFLGTAQDLQLPGRPIERLFVDSTDACKRRLVRRTDAGTEIMIDVERGTYLYHGAVLVNEASGAIIIERQEEEAVSVRLSDCLSAAELLAQGARLAHAFGNQHLPVEILDYEFRAPVTTSRDVMQRTIAQLMLPGVDVRFGKIRLGLHAPLLGAGGAHT